MNKKYFITLSPLDWFFFGGEKTFGEGEKSAYFAHSNSFPQQSAILGMLRYQLLKQHHLLVEDIKPEDKEKKLGKAGEIEQLIGEQSFNMSLLDKEFAFGKIKRISPLSIYNLHEDEFYCPLALDEGYSVHFDETIRVNLNGIIKKKVIVAEDFNHKTYSNYCLFKNSKTGDIINFKNIWLTKTQIGITKMQPDKQDDEKNFYKQEVLRLQNNFVFAFWAELDEELVSDKVFLGGQRSIFDMQVREIDSGQNIDELFKAKAVCYSENNEKIILLSDTFIEKMEDLNRLCDFHWSNPSEFRNIETTIKKTNYYIKPVKSPVKYYFFKRGSVFYFNSIQRNAIEELINNTYLQAVGYNIYK
ncbi:MAG: type III-B CRISPR module-associated Cmr3 family protein [Odoribacter splanchnicus]